jgi:hypothetical protein
MNKLTTISILLLATAAYAGGDTKGAPAPKTPDVKAPAPDAGKKAPDAPKMEAPKPAKELTDAGKAMTGTWKCTGQAAMGPGPMTDVKATMVQKMDLDGFWIQGQLSATMGKVSFKFTEYTGYDGKKWHRYGVDNMGGAREMETAAMAPEKTVWEGQGSMGGMPMKLRDTEEMGKDKSFHTVGEMSMDNGKSWTKEHDVTCKK